MGDGRDRREDVMAAVMQHEGGERSEPDLTVAQAVETVKLESRSL